VFSKGLLKTGIELVALARESAPASSAADHIHDDGLLAPKLARIKFSLKGVSRLASRRGEERARLLDV